MENFFLAMQSMPTAIYSVGMVIVAVYWVFVVIGALDIDLVSFDGPDLDVDLDIDLDANMDVGHHSPGFFNGTLEQLGIGTVPATIVFSLLVSSGWIIGLGLEVFLWPLLSSFMPVFLFAIGEFLIMFVLSIKIAALCVIPLKTNLKIRTIHGQEHLIGKIITVSSSEVTKMIGNGAYINEECDLTLNIRTEDDSLTFTKTEEVIISNYNKEKNIYIIKKINISEGGNIHA